jgi:hypothetical protein
LLSSQSSQRPARQEKNTCRYREGKKNILKDFKDNNSGINFNSRSKLTNPGEACKLPPQLVEMSIQTSFRQRFQALIANIISYEKRALSRFKKKKRESERESESKKIQFIQHPPPSLGGTS